MKNIIYHLGIILVLFFSTQNVNAQNCNDPNAHNNGQMGACETCFDAIQNGDETGVDCGGSNPNCAACAVDCDLAGSGVEFITDNDFEDKNIVTDGKFIAWQATPTGSGDSEIYFYNQQQPEWGIIQLTANSTDDQFPQLKKGLLTWENNNSTTNTSFDDEVYYLNLNFYNPIFDTQPNPKVPSLGNSPQTNGQHIVFFRPDIDGNNYYYFDTSNPNGGVSNLASPNIGGINTCGDLVVWLDAGNVHLFDFTNPQSGSKIISTLPNNSTAKLSPKTNGRYVSYLGFVPSVLYYHVFLYDNQNPTASPINISGTGESEQQDIDIGEELVVWLRQVGSNPTDVMAYYLPTGSGPGVISGQNTDNETKPQTSDLYTAWRASDHSVYYVEFGNNDEPTLVLGSNSIFAGVDFAGRIIAFPEDFGNLQEVAYYQIEGEDADNDGFCVENDCNDNEPTTYPGAEEICDNGIDDNCDGRIDENCCDHPDIDALVAFYEATNGDNWSINTGWDVNKSSDCSPCDWVGVGCETDVNAANFGRVTQLELSGINLTGNIPSSINQLTELRRLVLRSNPLSGGIPPELGDLTNLLHISFSFSPLGGSLPAELGNLENLLAFYAPECGLTGSIPASFGNLQELDNLSLTHNNLSGLLPSELGNLTNLTGLHLQNNQLEGMIPREWAGLTSLQILQLQNNNLEGCFFPELSALCGMNANLVGNNFVESNFDNFCNNGAGTCCDHPDFAWLMDVYFGSDGNNWTDNDGWDPSATAGCNPCSQNAGEKWCGVTCNNDNRVTVVRTSNNNMSGNINVVLNNAPPQLQEINFSNNNLSGGIPMAIGNLSNLTHLDLSNNNLEGEIIPEIYNLTQLTDISLRNNQLTGAIPAGLGTMQQLEKLDLGNNDLEGMIPITVVNNTNLTDLYLNNNNLTGPIPHSFGTFYQQAGMSAEALTKNMGQILDLSDNNLSGCYPPALKQTCNSNVNLDLSGNDDLPNGGNTSNFCFFDNGQCCEEPDFAALYELYYSTQGQNWLDKTNWDSDIFSGCDPCQWHGVTCDENGNITDIILLNNNLTGTISSGLGELSTLKTLHLGGNNLVGAIPTEIANLSNLENIQLYLNDLEGTIPVEFANLTNLKQLVLSSNHLTGTIPTALGSLTNIEKLWLNNNQLTGNIPLQLGDLTALKSLILSTNQLEGSIPAELADATNLESLLLFDNQLSGTLPEELGALTLNQIRVDDNQLSGCFPESYDSFCSLGETTDINGDGYNFSGNSGLPATGFGQFCADETGQCAPALVVELIQFTAKSKGNMNQMNWTTATEKDLYKFILENSPDGKTNWRPTAEVLSKGNSGVQQSYQAIDTQPFSKTFYRLRIIEFSGKEELSDIINIQRKEAVELQIIPNPAKDIVKIRTLQSEAVEIRIIDMLGRVVAQEILENDDLLIDISDWKSGVYFVATQLEGLTMVERFIVH